MGESSDAIHCTQREMLQALQASWLTLNQRLTAAQLAWLAEVERMKLLLPVSNRDHVQGLATAEVTVVEYTDFECPYCAEAYPIVKEIQRQLGASLRFVYRHFPRSDIHPHARHAV